MLFSFVKQKTDLNQNKKTNNIDNLIYKIENCINFSKHYSKQIKPKQLIESGKAWSIVFRTEINLEKQTHTFEYWIKGSDDVATYFTIIISTDSTQIHSIEDEYNYSINSTALQFSDNNTLQIIINDSIKL